MIVAGIGISRFFLTLLPLTITLNMARTQVIAGIDIGSSKVCTLIAQYNQEEEKLSVVGVSSVPAKGVRKGQIVDIEEAAQSVVQSVEAAERMAGYSLDHALVTIGGGHIESRNSHGVVAVADPSGEISANDVDRVIEAARAVSMPESREILHVLPREYKVDGETLVKDPEGMSGVRLEVETHLITGSTTAVKNILKCVSEVGITTDNLVFAGLASSFSVLSDTEKELGVVLVDIGGGTTSITAYVEGSIAYSSVLPIGGKNVTNDIAAGLRISLDAAESLKVSLSNEQRKKKSSEKEDEGVSDNLELGAGDLERKISKKTLIDGIIRPRMNEIFAMVGMELSHKAIAGKTPSGIVVTGGGSLCVGTQDSARRILSLPARIGFPTGISGLIDEIDSPAFAATTGLLLFRVKEQVVQKSGWSAGNFINRIQDLHVRGLLGRASEIFRKLLP